jgi:HAD superfamily hydrolase (TIGR01509 family)
VTLNNAKWIFFDLDGTLIQSTEALFHVYLEFLYERGHAGNKDEFDRLNGPSLDEIVALLRNQYSLSESNSELRKAYLGKIQTAYERLALPNHVTQSLRRIIAHGYKIGLVTSASKGVAEPLVKKIGEDLFSIVVYGDALRHAKPDPEIYDLAYKQSNARKDAIVVFEDSLNGYLSATRAGLRCVMIHGGVNLEHIWHFLGDGQYCSIILAKNIALLNIDSRLTVSTTQMENNLILDVKRLTCVNETIVVEGSFVSYDKFKQQRSSKINLETKITPIGVSGLVVLQQEAEVEDVLFATRSSMVTQYPGFLELVPSGGIDSTSLSANSQIDYHAKLLAELLEETGIEGNPAIDIKNLCLIFDPIEAVYDMCCIIEIGISQKSLLANFNKTKEYVTPQLVHLSELSKFLKERSNKLVPTSIALAKCYLYERNTI